MHGNTTNDTGIVDEDVDAAYFFLNLLYECLNSRFVSYVADITMSLDTLFFVGLQATIHEFLVYVIETNGSTLLSKSAGNSESDAVAGTCHESNLALKREIQIRIHCLQSACRRSLKLIDERLMLFQPQIYNIIFKYILSEVKKTTRAPKKEVE